ncbi:MAG: hypothetical protein EBU33_03360 [Sphingobacteriia bacterium]|jgi:hypothetical protein|nr:hypothetical protein [Sphingobacteriia bacterium]
MLVCANKLSNVPKLGSAALEQERAAKKLVICGWGKKVIPIGLNKVVSRGTPLVFCNDYLGSRLNKEGRKEILGGLKV